MALPWFGMARFVSLGPGRDRRCQIFGRFQRSETWPRPGQRVPKLWRCRCSEWPTFRPWARCQSSQGFMARSAPCFDTGGPARPKGAHFGQPQGTKWTEVETRPRPGQRVTTLWCCLCSEWPTFGPLARCQISGGFKARICSLFDTVGPAEPEGAHFVLLQQTKHPDSDTCPRLGPRVPKIGPRRGLEWPAF